MVNKEKLVNLNALDGYSVRCIRIAFTDNENASIFEVEFTGFPVE